jgi:hypothetical protein
MRESEQRCDGRSAQLSHLHYRAIEAFSRNRRRRDWIAPSRSVASLRAMVYV